MEYFPIYLKELRKKRGYETQSDLSDMCWISQGQLSRFESGQQTPTKETMYILCRVLNEPYVKMLENAYQKKLSDGDIQIVNNAEKIDSDLEQSLITVYKKLIKGLNPDIQSSYFSLLKSIVGARVADATFKRVMNDRTRIASSENQKITDYAIDKCSKREACKLFYTLIRSSVDRAKLNSDLQSILSPQQIDKTLDLGDETTGEVYVKGILMTKWERYMADQFVSSLRDFSSLY